jgi:hypothetical protein
MTERPPRPSDLSADLRVEGDRLELVTAPARWAAIPILAFALVWSGFLVVWYARALRHPSPSSIALWFPVLHVGVGVMMIVRAAALLLNRTRLVLDAHELVVVRGPLSRWKPVREVASGIERFIAGTRTQGIFERSSPFDRRRGEVEVPAVLVITRDHRSIALPLDLKHAGQASFLAAELDEQLRRTQRPPSPTGYRG